MERGAPSAPNGWKNVGLPASYSMPWTVFLHQPIAIYNLHVLICTWVKKFSIPHHCVIIKVGPDYDNYEQVGSGLEILIFSKY